MVLRWPSINIEGVVFFFTHEIDRLTDFPEATIDCRVHLGLLSPPPISIKKGNKT